MSSQFVPPPIPQKLQTSSDDFWLAVPPPVETSKAAATTPQIVLHDRDAKQKKATPWLTSITVHAALVLLIAMLLAPADFGGAARHVISLGFSDGDHDAGGEMFLMAQVKTADPAGDAALVDEFLSSPLSLGPEFFSPHSNGSGAGLGNQASRGGGGLRGSFFGIEAQGHDFVYILDISGSMKGIRYVRAAAELVKSVNNLDSSQRFYVLLFSGSTTQMFSKSNVLPSPIAATAQNKIQLANWLTEISPGGSTDPRQALSVALKMNPSAVFMLSDGEFVAPSPLSKPHGIFDSRTDAYEVVEAFADDIAIHAVAFEDPSSCGNMRRLADLTDGEYRFVEDSGQSPQSLIEEAKATRAAGGKVFAEMLLRHVIDTSPEDEIVQMARSELCKALAESLSDPAFSDDLSSLVVAMLSLAYADPAADISNELQSDLIDQITDQLRNQPTNPTVIATARELMAFVRDHTGTFAAMQLQTPLDSHLVQRTMALDLAKPDFDEYVQLDAVVTMWPASDVSRKCSEILYRYRADLLRQASQIEKTEGYVAGVRFLCRLATRSATTDLSSDAKSKIRELLFLKLATVRDAKLDRDHLLAFTIEREIDAAFTKAPDFEKLGREFLYLEKVASNRLSTAAKIDKGKSFDAARKQYQAIVSDFPFSLAATRVRERFEEMGVVLEETEVSEDNPAIESLTAD